VKSVPLAFVFAIAMIGVLMGERAPAAERFPLTSVDELEQKLLDQVNALRLSRGLRALRLSPELADAAHHHARDMARNGFCGHESANGRSFWERVLRFYGRGTRWRRWAAAENVLCHPRRLSAAAAIRRWLASPGHRANLLGREWRDVGVAALWADAAPGEFGGRDVFVVTTNFGARR
jgi:uncharacterized protein YkwD